jgi:chromosome segregation ATPase
MLRKVLTENYEVNQAQLVQHIYRSLEGIQQQLEEEVLNKQTIIDGCAQEIKALHAQVESKSQVIQNLEAIILENQRNIEGNRQLINKLLNDLDRMQQAIEWYKRTYETRSLLGVIKDKLKHMIS